MIPFRAGRHVVGWLVGVALAALLFLSVDCGSTVAVTSPIRIYNCDQRPGTSSGSELHCIEATEGRDPQPADAGQSGPQAAFKVLLRVKG